MKKPVMIIAIIAGILTIFALVYYKNNPLSAKVTINKNTIYVDVAVTPQEKERGLGYRSSMPENRGMIFLFDHKDFYSFWMKGMQFPLDFIWIADNTVVDITERVPVATSGTMQTIKPNYPADKILEVNAGIVSKYRIKRGDTVIFMR